MDPTKNPSPSLLGVATPAAETSGPDIADGVEVDLSRGSSAWGSFDDDSPLPPRKPRLLTPITGVLAAVLLATGGFALGAKVGRSSAPAAAAAALPAGFGANRTGGLGATTTVAGRAGTTPTTVAGAGAAGAAGANAAAAGGFGGGNATFGTIKLIDGTNVYLQDASGNVIKISTTPDSNITVSKKGTVADLKAGDTVVVQGTTDADGNIAAASITSGASLGAGRQRGQGGTAASSNTNGQAGG